MLERAVRAVLKEKRVLGVGGGPEQGNRLRGEPLDAPHHLGRIEARRIRQRPVEHPMREVPGPEAPLGQHADQHRRFRQRVRVRRAECPGGRRAGKPGGHAPAARQVERDRDRRPLLADHVQKRVRSADQSAARRKEWPPGRPLTLLDGEPHPVAHRHVVRALGHAPDHAVFLRHRHRSAASVDGAQVLQMPPVFVVVYRMGVSGEPERTRGVPYAHDDGHPGEVH